MFSLKINLIGCDERIVPEAAREYLQRWGVVDNEYPSVATIQNAVLMKEGETRLLIMYVSDARDVPELKRLNSTYPRYAILAVLDADSDRALVMQCIRAGAMQVVHAPVSPDELKESLDCIAAKHQGLSPLAKMVAVTSARGGAGGTTVAMNLSSELARISRTQCILMELSMRMGKLANYLDITPQYTIPDLVTDIDRMDSYILQAALTRVTENLSVLVGPYHAIQQEPVDLESTMQLILLTRHLAAWLVLDTPCTYDELYFRSLMAADQIVIVADQSVAAIRNVQLICDTIAQRRPIVAVNRCTSNTSGLPISKIKEFLPSCEVCQLANDATVSAAANDGKLLCKYNPRSPFLADLESLVRQLDPDARRNDTTESSESILRRLGRALSLS
jgi:pilus assembly protein CpaE